MAKRIHIVEDDEDIRFIVEYLLRDENYEVESFGSAKEFDQGIKDNKPDLIILDVMLPDGNGISICRNLKTNSDTLHIPIIIMSAHAAEKSVLEEACADDFISKPFDLDYFLQRVKKQLTA
ncbi:two-component system phosphate regulon response regulator PhoB [Pedobacter africanus]|uniref:DNA-binding response OmpR family regulator n=1 Tax=Pedobacter africanus TaxID=151894 RepID=A0ACC6KTA0_9SPHI|nr:response regulator [Pedobacter africanus]MDR6782417.1 DNA-binding response OmpR family regulator [Pedobacter africanus]